VKHFIVLGGMATLMVVVAACGGGNVGNVIPTTTTTASTSSAPTTTSISTPLAITDPCWLLPASAATSLGYPAQGKSQTTGGQPDCQYDGTPGVADVGIFATLGLSQVVPDRGTPVDITVGKHQAKQLDQGSGICRISLGVTPTSRVDVEVTTTTGSPSAGALAIAKAVEPNLPPS
jgi:hypothetical protein